MRLEEAQNLAGDHSGRMRRVIDFNLALQRLVGECKQDDFSSESWSELADLVATDVFVRVGGFKEVMDWASFLAYLARWAPTAEWDGSFKRIVESDGVVFLEMEERITYEPGTTTANSLTVYEFDRSDRIHRLDVYMQMHIPAVESLKNFAGIKISE